MNQARFLVGFALLGVLAGSAAAVELPANLANVDLATPEQSESAEASLGIAIDFAAVSRLWDLGSARIRGFPLPGGEHVDLELVSFDLLAPDAAFFVGRGDEIQEIPPPAFRFYRGQVRGEPDSLVSLNLFGGRIAGFIRRGDQEWTFAPRSFALDGEGAFDVRVWRSSDESGPGGLCAGEELPPNPAGAGFGAFSQATFLPEIDGTTLLRAKIAVEGTVEWSAKHGGAAGAQTYTLNLMSQVSAIYENDLKVQIQVPYVLMNTVEPDGYSGGSNSASTVLNEMRAKWNASATLRAVFRSAVHVFSTYASGGSGIAYVNILCDNVPQDSNSADYGVSLLQGNAASFERILTAHEIGHGFSSPHTHCYVPPIDQCYNTQAGCYSGTVVQTTGTIMSYCSAKTSLFDPRCINEKLRPAAQAAYPACVEVAGSPGEIRPQDGSGLTVAGVNYCGPATLQNDDGTGNGNLSYGGTAQAAWIKRLLLPCYPFKLTRVDLQINNASVAVGRPIRLLVYRDPAATFNPANATLVYTQDVTVQAVSSSVFNQYTLTTPVIIQAGHLYVGFYDLSADATSTFIMRYDTSRTGDSWNQAGSTDPAGYGSFANGTWMIRAQGGGVLPGSLRLSWGAPCNNATVPGQDYAVYQGTIGNFSSLTSLTCSTGRATSWIVESPPGRRFWLVVPQTSVSEGSYGPKTSGQRTPAALACKPQAIVACN